MKDTPNYYAIIPADVRYDPNLKDKAKLLYGEIIALSDKTGYCYASNKYFAELYGISQTTVSLLIKDLIQNRYIESEIIYKEGTKEILNRYLRIIKGGYLRNFKEGYLKNLKDNNINNNNTSINKENYIKEFEKFWKHYPRKLKKQKSLEAFIKCKPTKELVEIMIKQVERFKDTKQWKEENGKYIPHPTTWINNKRWEDEFETDTEREERIDREIMEGIYGT